MKKAVVSCLLLCLIMAGPVFSAPIGLEDLRETMDSFANELALSLPFNSGMGLNWADAHIKNFPHFGVGFSAGFTTMEASAFSKLVDFFSPALPDWVLDFGGFPLPGYAAEGRIGGLILPFDVGIKVGILPIQPTDDTFRRLDYYLVGGDVRYRLLEDKGLLPGVSVGVGYSYMKGGLGMTPGNDTSMNYAYPDLSDPTNPIIVQDSITLKAPELDLDWETNSLDFKVQVSKNLLLFTPYVGFGASNGWSKAGYSVSTKITDSTGNPINLGDLRPIMEAAGLEGFSADGFGSSSEFSGWSYRVYGGIAFNFTVLKIELTGLYNFMDKKFGGTIGARLQL